MCDSRDSKFVVPKKPGAGMGWWIGQDMGNEATVHSLAGQEVNLKRVNVLWVENARYDGCTSIAAAAHNLIEFDSATEALEYLRQKGAVMHEPVGAISSV